MGGVKKAGNRYLAVVTKEYAAQGMGPAAYTREIGSNLW